MTHASASYITSPSWEPGWEDESAVCAQSALITRILSDAVRWVLQKRGIILEPIMGQLLDCEHIERA